MKANPLIALILIMTVLLISCKKENIDKVEDDIENPIPIDTTYCELNLSFSFMNNELAVVVNQGQSPYTYLWSNQNTTSSITIDTSGLYSVTATDSRGCTGIKDTTIVSSACNTFDVTIKEDSSYLITEINGGLSPYTYIWSTGDSVENLLIENNCGQYSVTITDANNCSAEQFYLYEIDMIFEAKIVQQDSSSLKDLDVIINGGQSPYSYTWSTGAVTSSIQTNGTGSYRITVTDSNGCFTGDIFNF